MSDHMSKSLDELKQQVIADGVIDADEVAKIRERLYADGKIDHDEAEFIFDVNDAVSDANNDAAWQMLFVDVVCDHVLEDEDSPGAIDEEEAEWILKRVQGDGNFDKAEKALFEALKSKTGSLPAKLASFVETA